MADRIRRAEMKIAAADDFKWVKFGEGEDEQKASRRSWPAGVEQADRVAEMVEAQAF